MTAREASNALRLQASKLLEASRAMETVDASTVDPENLVRATAYLLGLLGELKLTVARVFDELEPFIANADVCSHVSMDVFERPPFEDDAFRDPQ